MKTLAFLSLCLLGLGSLGIEPAAQQNTAKTEIAGKGPCTNFPKRYQKLEERLAWFYGCMHENPPTIEEIRAKIAALPSDKREKLVGLGIADQEAILGMASGDLPASVYTK
jgi:hypothetical protein